MPVEKMIRGSRKFQWHSELVAKVKKLFIYISCKTCKWLSQSIWAIIISWDPWTSANAIPEAGSNTAQGSSKVPWPVHPQPPRIWHQKEEEGSIRDKASPSTASSRRFTRTREPGTMKQTAASHSTPGLPATKQQGLLRSRHQPQHTSDKWPPV